MIATFSVKVTAGPRTPARIEVSTAGAVKTFTLINGVELNNTDIMQYLQDELDKWMKDQETQR